MREDGRTVIRQRRHDDREAIFALFNEEAFRRFGSTMEPFTSIVTFEEWMAGLSTPNFELVAEVDGCFAGFAGLYPFSARQSHVGGMFLGVREALHGRGVGTKLVHALVTLADALTNLRRIQITVFSDNPNAMRLYQKFGFEIEGRHRAAIRRDDEFVDLYTMARIRNAQTDTFEIPDKIIIADTLRQE